MNHSLKDIKQNAAAFLEVKSPLKLVQLLFNKTFLSLRDVARLAEFPEYRTFFIAKRTGGKREISAPCVALWRWQQSLNHYLNSVYYLQKHEACCGFLINSELDKSVPGIVRNASVHAGNPHLLNIDVSDFFHSISAARVKQLFLSAPFCYTEELASCLALLCVYQKRLPMGAPTSPVLSNFICLPLDHKLNALAAKNKFNYSRYADDISFSAEIPFMQNVVDEIRAIITEEGFTVNEKKFRIQSRYKRQEVTGLTVNEKVNVNRRYIRNIRAAFYEWTLAAKELQTVESGFINSLRGRIEFVGQVRGKTDSLYINMRRRFDRMVNPPEFDID